MLKFFLIVFAVIQINLYAQTGTVTEQIKVNQLGYLPNAKKIAVLSNPKNGYNSDITFSPGNTYQIRKVSDNSVVYSGGITAWNNGQTHQQSGDQVWWFDFSSVSTEGEYYVYDQTNDVSSYSFEINANVYKDLLKQVMRTFYYQRCGTPKAAPYAESNWVDGNSCHLGTEQDSDCRWVLDTSPSTSKDLSGGWHDAGDYNKYTNTADNAIHDLLSAYEEEPAAWDDDYDIPESGNGIPDIIDEIKWELDWLLKMQLDDGSVLHKVSATTWGSASPPSADTEMRRYAEATSSATVSTCGAFAHAAIVFKTINNSSLQSYATTLKNKAVAAWNWLEANPDKIPSNYNNQGFVNPATEDEPYDQYANRLLSACYLFYLTGETKYRDYVDAHYTELRMFTEDYLNPYDVPYQDALLYYTKTPGATTTVVNNILSTYERQVKGWLDYHTFNVDAYRAYLPNDEYDWGSNHIKSDQASLYTSAIFYEIDQANKNDYYDAAISIIHYMFGVNPTGYAYLTNLANYGFENSVNEVYHEWFGDGTDWDNAQTSLYGPAPAILTGGPNKNYQPDADYTGPPIEPPQNQPPQKSYKDWNTSYPENSWEVTENAIYYESAFARLLSKFVFDAESSILLKVKVFLEGPYNTNSDLMGTNINADIPLTSPYSEDPRTVTSIPTDIVDWVLIQLRNTPSGTTVVSKSVFLHKDGRLVNDDGNTDEIVLDAPEGNYYIIINHRNHLNIMSSTTASLNSVTATLYDFTTSDSQFYGTGGAVELETGVWGMWSGDADGSDVIDASDRNSTWNDRNKTGYENIDVDLSGVVDAGDRNKTWNNRNNNSQVP